jgi:hypothetical protein
MILSSRLALTLHDNRSTMPFNITLYPKSNTMANILSLLLLSASTLLIRLFLTLLAAIYYIKNYPNGLSRAIVRKLSA